MKSELRNRLRTALINNESFRTNQSLRALFADSRLRNWQNSLPEATNVSMRVNYVVADLVDRGDTNGENALYLMLHTLYDNSGSNELLELTEMVFNTTINTAVERCKIELERLQSNYGKSWDDSEYNRRRQAELVQQIKDLLLKKNTKEIEKMIVQRVVPEVSLDSLISDLTALELKKKQFEKFGADVPDGLEQKIKTLTRKIKMFVEDEKDAKRVVLQAELQETESRKEKQARLKKELAELEN